MAGEMANALTVMTMRRSALRTIFAKPSVDFEDSVEVMVRFIVTPYGGNRLRRLLNRRMSNFKRKVRERQRKSRPPLLVRCALRTPQNMMGKEWNCISFAIFVPL